MEQVLPKRSIISIDVSFGSYNQFVGAIINQASAKISAYVCVANVHMLLEAHQSPQFKEVVDGAFLVTPDGMPLAKAFKALYGFDQERVDGMSLLPALLQQAEQECLSVYFYGGTQSMLDKTADFVTRSYPELTIAGTYSPPFRDLSDIEMDEIASEITASGANLVFVVLGCPKQEKWMYQMKGRIPCTMVGIGGALPVLVGIQKRAPGWMQKNSLEWLFRLNQEPKRLFKRYLKTNTYFLYLMAQSRITMVGRRVASNVLNYES
jgi:N-acetylglucosaminyldiphosphoundecaprenol N-acetyl-beta-D-mannosaminyltransferase